jgi:DNA-binding XRE family transcriptional regulator
MARRRIHGWAIYNKDDAYKPGLLVPSAETRTVHAVDVKWNRKLKTIREAAELAQAAQGRIEQFVGIARRDGATWEQVASVLGVTRQAAWFKYHAHPVAGGTPRGRRSLVDTLNTLRAHAERSQAVNIRVAELVQEARETGRSWENIAQELGVRRQTAWERYAATNLVSDDPTRPSGL